MKNTIRVSSFILFSLLLFLFCSTRVWAIDSISEWSPTINFPESLASNVSFSIGKKIFSQGGSASFGFSRYFVVSATPNSADGTISSWNSSSAPLPKALIWHSVASDGNRVYILGGKEEILGSPIDYSNSVYKAIIDSSGNITGWTTLTPLPYKLSQGAAGIVGNYLYFAGGAPDSSIPNAVFMALINSDGTIGSWTKVATLPVYLIGSTMITTSNSLTLVGGADASSFVFAVKPDGTLGPIQTTTSLPQVRYRAQTVKVGSKVFVMGGSGGPGSSSIFDTVYYADISSTGQLGAWTLSSHHLPVPICCGAASVVNNYIYIIGGYGGVYSNYLSSVYVVHVEAQPPLAVPYFSQNALPWGPTEYDHAKSLGFSNITMDRWGCAITSAAMVMNYHGMTKMLDGSNLDPGTLNVWLKNNNGYLEGKGKDGGYAYILWNSIGTLSQKLFNDHKSTVKLMHQRLYPNTTTDGVLVSDLTTNNIPDILQVKNNLTTSHFVVVKGVDNGSFLINDPEWDYPNLSSFNNKYYQVDRYIPSHTDLSYIVFVVNPDQELLVTDPQGKKTGKLVQGTTISEYSEIPNALYQFEDPINNPNSANSPENLGTGVKSFLLPTPSEGLYQITVSSKVSSLYTLHMVGYTTEGDAADTTILGTSNPTQTQTYQFSFSSTSPSTVQNPVTFATTLTDIKEAYDLDLMHDSTYYVLSSKIKAVQADFVNNRKTMALFKLNEFKSMLESYRGKSLNEIAYQALTRDADYLLAHFDTL